MLQEYSKKFLALDVFALGFVLVNGWALYWDSTVEDAVLPIQNLGISVRAISLGVFVVVLLILAALYFFEFHRGGKAVRLRYFITVVLIAACFVAEYNFHLIMPAPVAAGGG